MMLEVDVQRTMKFPAVCKIVDHFQIFFVGAVWTNNCREGNRESGHTPQLNRTRIWLSVARQLMLRRASIEVEGLMTWSSRRKPWASVGPSHGAMSGTNFKKNQKSKTPYLVHYKSCHLTEWFSSTERFDLDCNYIDEVSSSITTKGVPLKKNRTWGRNFF